jgi:alpha-1,3-glucosyltransferase
MVDLHFQYNLLMQSILILCVGFMEEKKYLKASFFYATLLNFKHIYLYCSPAFFFVIIKEYILRKSLP